MAHTSQFALLSQSRFSNFFYSQLTSSFNDNVFKNFLVLMVTYQAALWTTQSPALISNLASGLFILPYVVFSATAGQMSDKYDKALMMRAIKGIEVLIMLVAGVGFYLHSLPALLGVLFLLGCHSAVYGPVKYSILGRVLSDAELTGGNGLVEMGTFLAILVGTITAGVIVAKGASLFVISGLLIAVAIVGFLFAMRIPRTGCAAPDLKVDYTLFKPTLEVIKDAREVRSVWLSLLGISWFWFFGSLMLTQLPALAKGTLKGSESLVTCLLAVFSIGVATGSLLCEKLSSRKVEIGLVPFASIGLSIFAVDLYCASTAFNHVGLPYRVFVDLFFVGVFGGLYIVPLYALVQSRSDKAKQSRVIAANNILNALFMVVAAGVAAGLLAFGISVPGLILAGALLNVLVAIYIYSLVPEFLWRFVDWLVVHSLYHVKVKGVENIPEDGPALLVCNHVSFADALVLAAAIPRPVRFLMDKPIFDTPGINLLFKAAKAIPIASQKTHPEVYERAFADVDTALANGELVLIFPEGKITYDGVLNQFKPGYSKILERNKVPLIPIAVSGLWGSMFSRKPGSRKLMGLCKEIWLPIDVTIAAPHSGVTPAPEALRSIVADMLNKRQRPEETVHPD